MDRYHIYEEVGRGGHCIVYKGREKQNVRYVAIKSVDKSKLDKVLHEVRVLYKLEHPNCLRFFKWYETRHHIWLILEYCTGGSLKTLLRQDGRLPETAIRVFGADLLQALHYLHSNGIIFADLKPSNILLNEYGVLKLSDFALAVTLDSPEKQKVQEGGADTKSKEKAVKFGGTPVYMAPELFTSEGVHSFASDFWALGCVLFEMALGRVPFQSSIFSELVKMIQSDPLRLPVTDDEINETVALSATFKNLLRSLLRKDPSKRITWPALLVHEFWDGIPLPSFHMMPTNQMYQSYLETRTYVPHCDEEDTDDESESEENNGWDSSNKQRQIEKFEEEKEVEENSGGRQSRSQSLLDEESLRLSRAAKKNLLRESADSGSGLYLRGTLSQSLEEPAYISQSNNGTDLILDNPDTVLNFEEQSDTSTDEVEEEEDGETALREKQQQWNEKESSMAGLGGNLRSSSAALRHEEEDASAPVLARPHTAPQTTSSPKGTTPLLEQDPGVLYSPSDAQSGDDDSFFATSPHAMSSTRPLTAGAYSNLNSPRTPAREKPKSPLREKRPSLQEAAAAVLQLQYEESSDEGDDSEPKSNKVKRDKTEDVGDDNASDGDNRDSGPLAREELDASDTEEPPYTKAQLLNYDEMVIPTLAKKAARFQDESEDASEFAQEGHEKSTRVELLEIKSDEDADPLQGFFDPYLLEAVHEIQKSTQTRLMLKQLAALIPEDATNGFKSIPVHFTQASDFLVKPIVGNPATGNLPILKYNAKSLGFPNRPVEDVASLNGPALEQFLGQVFRALSGAGPGSGPSYLIHVLGYLYSLCHNPRLANVIVSSSLLTLLIRLGSKTDVILQHQQQRQQQKEQIPRDLSESFLTSVPGSPRSPFSSSHAPSTPRTPPSTPDAGSFWSSASHAGSSSTARGSTSTKSLIRKLRVRVSIIVAVLIRHATFIAPRLGEEGLLSLFVMFSKDNHPPLRKYGTAGLGELLFYITANSLSHNDASEGVVGQTPTSTSSSANASVSASAAWKISGTALKQLLACLQSEDEKVRFFAAKTYENVLSTTCEAMSAWGQTSGGNSSFATTSTQANVSSLRVHTGVGVGTSGAGMPPGLRFATHDVAAALLNCAIREKSDLLRSTCAMALSHLVRLNRRLLPRLAEKEGWGFLVNHLQAVHGSPRVQQAFLNILYLVLSSGSQAASAGTGSGSVPSSPSLSSLGRKPSTPTLFSRGLGGAVTPSRLGAERVTRETLFGPRSKVKKQLVKSLLQLVSYGQTLTVRGKAVLMLSMFLKVYPGEIDSLVEMKLVQILDRSQAKLISMLGFGEGPSSKGLPAQAWSMQDETAHQQQQQDQQQQQQQEGHGRRRAFSIKMEELVEKEGGAVGTLHLRRSLGQLSLTIAGVVDEAVESVGKASTKLAPLLGSRRLLSASSPEANILDRLAQEVLPVLVQMNRSQVLTDYISCNADLIRSMASLVRVCAYVKEGTVAGYSRQVLGLTESIVQHEGAIARLEVNVVVLQELLPAIWFLGTHEQELDTKVLCLRMSSDLIRAFLTRYESISSVAAAGLTEEDHENDEVVLDIKDLRNRLDKSLEHFVVHSVFPRLRQFLETQGSDKASWNAMLQISIRLLIDMVSIRPRLAQDAHEAGLTQGLLACLSAMRVEEADVGDGDPSRPMAEVNGDNAMKSSNRDSVSGIEPKNLVLLFQYFRLLVEVGSKDVEAYLFSPRGQLLSRTLQGIQRVFEWVSMEQEEEESRRQAWEDSMAQVSQRRPRAAGLHGGSMFDVSQSEWMESLSWQLLESVLNLLNELLASGAKKDPHIREEAEARLTASGLNEVLALVASFLERNVRQGHSGTKVGLWMSTISSAGHSTGFELSSVFAEAGAVNSHKVNSFPHQALANNSVLDSAAVKVGCQCLLSLEKLCGQSVWLRVLSCKRFFSLTCAVLLLEDDYSVAVDEDVRDHKEKGIKDMIQEAKKCLLEFYADALEHSTLLQEILSGWTVEERQPLYSALENLTHSHQSFGASMHSGRRTKRALAGSRLEDFDAETESESSSESGEDDSENSNGSMEETRELAAQLLAKLQQSS